MIGDIVCRVSSVTARDLLREILPDEEPTIDRVVTLAEELWRSRKMWVSVNYLLNIWMAERKAND